MNKFDKQAKTIEDFYGKPPHLSENDYERVLTAWQNGWQNGNAPEKKPQIVNCPNCLCDFPTDQQTCKFCGLTLPF